MRKHSSLINQARKNLEKPALRKVKWINSIRVKGEPDPLSKKQRKNGIGFNAVIRPEEDYEDGDDGTAVVTRKSIL